MNATALAITQRSRLSARFAFTISTPGLLAIALAGQPCAAASWSAVPGGGDLMCVLEFEADDVRITEIDGYQLVQLAGASTHRTGEQAGAPALPVAAVHFVLPRQATIAFPLFLAPWPRIFAAAAFRSTMSCCSSMRNCTARSLIATSLLARAAISCSTSFCVGSGCCRTL